MSNKNETYFVTSCMLNCKKKHNENDIVVRINLNDLDEDQDQDTELDLQMMLDAVQNEQDIIKYNINLNQMICDNKLHTLYRLINAQQGVSLEIKEIDSRTITCLSKILKGDKINSISLNFIQLFSKYKQSNLHDLFNLVQKLPNLECLKISNQDDMCQSNPVRFQRSILQVTENGSLSQLKQLTISSALMQMNSLTFQNLEKAMIDPDRKREGVLTHFSLNAVECDLDSKSFHFINRILYHNRKTLQSLDIKLIETDFKTNNPLNEIGRSIGEMSSLVSVKVQLNLIQSEFEQVNTDLSRFLEGVGENESIQDIQIALFNVYIMSCSNLGDALKNIPSIQFFGQISHPQALEMGISLAKSTKLDSLQISSQSEFIGLMLSYIFHFSKNLRKVHIDYQGKQLHVFKDIQAGLAANTSITEFQITTSNQYLFNVKAIYHLGIAIKLNKSITKLVLIFGNTKGDFQWFHQFFQEIAASSQLAELTLDFNQEQSNDKFNPDILVESLSKLKTLSIFEFSFSPFTIRKKDKLIFIKLLKGLINHQYAFNFCLNDRFADLKQIQDNIYYECENLMLRQIAFYKYISSLLHYHPNRHVEDLYFV